MKRIAMASVLALCAALPSSTALAADGARGDAPAEVESGVATLRVVSRVDNNCQVWVNGSLRATIGPFGDSGVLSTAPTSTDFVTELLVRCENVVYHRIVKPVHTHCDFVVDPTAVDPAAAHCT